MKSAKIDEAIDDIRRIKDPSELASELGADPIPFASLKEAPLADAEPSGSRVQPLKLQGSANLRLNWANSGAISSLPLSRLRPKIIIVMGAQRGAGATQIAAGLAIIGAEADRELRIALVDFNVRNSSDRRPAAA